MSSGTHVGVRELKARLSAHLKRVQAGAHVVVTDRGRPIARLEPVEHPPETAWATVMSAGGAARWTGGKPRGLHPRQPAKGRPASRMVIEDRR